MHEAWGHLAARRKRWPWHRFAAGVVAGSGGLVLTFVMRMLSLGVFLPEVAVDFVVGRIPGEIESLFISTMGEGAKVLGLAIAFAVFLVLPGVFAVPYRWIEARLRGRYRVMVFYTFSATAIVLLAVLPLLGGGFFGAETQAGAGFASFSQLLGFWLYAALLDYFLVDVAARHPRGFRLSRRQFLAATAGAVLAAGLAVVGLASLATRKGRLVFGSVAEMFSKEITPTEEFYVVTKNVIDPTVNPGAWRLEIGGMVSNPTSMTYAEVLALADVDEFVTLECVSNEVGGNLISNAKWTGVRLADLLRAAGVDAGATWVRFACADGYTVGIPMDRAMDPATLLAVRMNDAPLTVAHGFPARAIVPGVYGMFHAKWVTRIEPVASEFVGFWQQKGWTNEGRARTTAIIATPPADRIVGGAVTLGGVAFSGDRGISRVEVSTDGGATWREATLKSPVDPRRTWVLWTFDWAPPGSGSYRIQARAVDGDGVPQEPAPAPPFPAGASGYDSITLLVSV